MLTRRTLLAAGAVGAASAAASCGGEGAGETPAPDADEAPALPSDVNAGTLAEAEKLFGVRYTDREREQILATLAEPLAQVRARRSFALDFAVAPGVSFDPRPTGFRMPDPARRVERVPLDPGPLPASEADIAFASLAQLGAWLETGALTSVRLTELYLARLERYGPTLECVAERTPALALEQAARADRERAQGQRRGPLHGIPFGAKDLLDTRGVATRFGAEPYRERVPVEDAVVIRRLYEAGAVLAAKLSLGALAYGDVWDGGRTRNPWNPDEGSSGSSAGSAAATAAGLVGFAIGSETYGSIVSPSMRCGTTGLRPTFGRVARSGAMPLCWSLDKLGPICRAVEDTLLVLAAIDGADPGDPASRDAGLAFSARAAVQARRLGYVPSAFEGEDATDVERSALAAARALGVELVPLELPDLPYDSLLTVLYAEAAAAFEELTLSDRDDQLTRQDDDAWPNTFRRSRLLSAVDLVQAERLRRVVMQRFAELFAGVDALLAPAFGGPLLLATNFTGHPALVLRAGFEQRGARQRGSAAEEGSKREVPRGIVLYGRLYDEGALCELGLALERQLGVWQRRPPGFA